MPSRSLAEAMAESQALYDAATPEEREDAEYAQWEANIEYPLRDWLDRVIPNATGEDIDQAVKVARDAARPGEYDLIAVLQRVARKQNEREARKKYSATPAPVGAAVAVSAPRPRARQQRRTRTRATPSADDGPAPSRLIASFATVDDANTRARAVDIIRQLMARGEARR